MILHLLYHSDPCMTYLISGKWLVFFTYIQTYNSTSPFLKLISRWRLISIIFLYHCFYIPFNVGQHLCWIKLEFFNLSTVNILGQIILCYGKCPGHCRMSGIIPDLNPQIPVVHLPPSCDHKSLQILPNVPQGTKFSPSPSWESLGE